MENKNLIELNKTWIYEHLCDVTEEDIGWVLIQEPGFIGFGVVMKNDICFPPGVEPDWTLISDLRLFGEKGEWHVWRDWDAKHYARLLELEKIDDVITEHHFLWGTKIAKKEDTHPWIKVVEDRGAEIWLPLGKEGLEDSDLPLRLKIKQIIDYDPESHLAGITDAALVGLTRESKKVIFPPSSFSGS